MTRLHSHRRGAPRPQESGGRCRKQMRPHRRNHIKARVHMEKPDRQDTLGAWKHRLDIADMARAAVSVFSCIAFGLLPSVVRAADSSGVGNALEDVKLYFTAPLRWDAEDWLYFGGTLALIGASHQLDARVRTHFATGSNAALNGGEDKDAVRDALPAVAIIAGTWAYAGLLGDSDGYRETWRLIEAGVLSTASGEALSYAAGRERPDATTSPNQWREGGDSFPSVHASAAFAIGTVFAESGNDDYRWVRRVIGYGIGAGTAYIRVRDNVHWLSDTVAGSALGIATARFVLNREDTAHRASVQFQPVKNGWLISYSVRFD
jgi:membrane-associated phospholipid phosphatase